MELKRYFIEFAFDGTDYCGWQIQPNAITVQEVINKALGTILREEINVVGAGRTDTGVHARFFVAHFETIVDIDTEKLSYKLNSFLPKDISVFKIYRVKPDAHSRFTALSRTYQYFITEQKDAFSHKFTYHPYFKPNYDLMNQAAKILFEYTDFSCFSKSRTQTKTNNCEIMHAEWECGEHNVFTIKADRFLRNMVRAIVGTLLEVGQGKLSEEDFRSVIESKDRKKAGFSVPASGLFLCGIEYPPNIVF